MKQSELPANILILSDMEFDSCATTSNFGATGYRGRGIDKKLFAVIAKRYAKHGYKLPRLVFWNICSRTGTIPVKKKERPWCCFGKRLQPRHRQDGSQQFHRPV